MNNKEKYRDFCKTEKNIPIFSKDWWLDSVCPDNKTWDVVLVEKGGQIVASMPYVIGKSHGFNTISMPQLTQNMGPYIKYPDNQKYDTKLSYEKEIMNELIKQIPGVAYFNQNFNYAITNWQPFYWNGFRQTTNYTYVIDNIKDLDTVFDNFSKNTRNKIRKASKILNVELSDDIDKFYEINQMTFNRQGLEPPYSLEFLRKLYTALISHNSGKIFMGIDQNKQMHSAVVMIWDAQSAYFLMSGGNPELRSSGSGDLVKWKAICYASNLVQRMDFEGSMIEKVEAFNRGFGAIQKPYFNISKTYSKVYKLLKLSNEILKTLKE